MKIFDGKKLSEQILRGLKKEIKKRKLKLRLAIIQVDQDPVSRIFINQKEKACQKTGIDFKLYKFPKDINSAKLKEQINKVAKSSLNSGIIIQLPLPKKFDTKETLNLIPPEKDIDVLSEKSQSQFCLGNLKILPPPLAGIIKLLKEYKIKIKGKYFVVVGTGRLIGRSLVLWLLQQKATVSVLDKFTPDISFFTKKADILISGVGKPGLITGSMLKKGIVVIDAGTSLKKGKLRGDCDFKSVSRKASYITPVPGGVGPMTVACLLENLVKLNK